MMHNISLGTMPAVLANRGSAPVTRSFGAFFPAA